MTPRQAAQRRKKLEALYFERLHDYVDRIFQRAASLDWSARDLALEAALHPNTIERLRTHVTALPQLRTICKLAWALSMEVSIDVANVSALKLAELAGGRRRRRRAA